MMKFARNTMKYPLMRYFAGVLFLLIVCCFGGRRLCLCVRNISQRVPCKGHLSASRHVTRVTSCVTPGH